MGIKTLFNRIFEPSTCAVCGKIIEEDEFLCHYCYEMICFCDPVKRCISCGANKKDCQCKRHVFHFNSCIAPFVNIGVARKAMHRFKFRKKLNIAEFFARQMALSIKTEYRNIDFNGICYVPMPFRKMARRGYNQSKILAERLSEILNLPIYDVLVCKYSNTIQHKLSEKERFKNVKDKYSVKQNVIGKKLLLIDDIKTTGATLDECARKLILAGAEGVYCATALISEKNKPKKG